MKIVPGQIRTVHDCSEADHQPLIPGLPDEIAEQCLLRLPYPYHSLFRSVSSAWNRTLSNPNFLSSKKTHPYLFIFSSDHRNHHRWLSFDPRHRRWFTLPPPPSPSPPIGFATAADSRSGSLFVLGGLLSDDSAAPLRTLLSYSATTNSWSASLSPMPTPRSFFAAGAVNGKIVSAGGGGVDVYDPAEDRWTTSSAAGNGRWGGLGKYDAAVVKGRMHVTEGWTWPFNSSPRAGVYDAEGDTWREMKVGMREGWTGASVVLEGGRLVVVSECGERRLKVYEEGMDSWAYVEGEGVPEEIGRPYAVGGAERTVYVVAGGLDVGIGRLGCDGKGGWRVEWEVVKGPKVFEGWVPQHCQVLYA
ncbi:F-box protein AFR [Acorus calamus]|uniref:F-box protein AFR n=1 Tax=Acorus calamus TaxID=4465 RepID=A0AAV9CZF4_ACOCL|nr:F-box protein AFR [Acorus calamus]